QNQRDNRQDQLVPQQPIKFMRAAKECWTGPVDELGKAGNNQSKTHPAIQLPVDKHTQNQKDQSDGPEKPEFTDLFCFRFPFIDCLAQILLRFKRFESRIFELSEPTSRTLC